MRAADAALVVLQGSELLDCEALLRLRDAGEPLPGGAVLLSPFLDVTASADATLQVAGRAVDMAPVFREGAARSDDGRVLVADPLEESVAGEPMVMGPVPGLDLHFIVAGFAKCGTTTLSALLDNHPQLFIPTTESWFFGSNSLLDDSGYAAFFRRSVAWSEDRGVQRRLQ